MTAIRLIGAKSLIGSYSSFAYTLGATTWVLVLPTSSE